MNAWTRMMCVDYMRWSSSSKSSSKPMDEASKSCSSSPKSAGDGWSSRLRREFFSNSSDISRSGADALMAATVRYFLFGCPA